MKQAAQKYRPFPPVRLTDRTWPDQTIDKAPVWMSTDLRDGNQALFEPMNAEKKLGMFRMLCEIGFKEIEVAFPAASQTDFDFVRTLIADGHIPDDVSIEVLTQARPALIERTIESLAGAKRAIVHVYTATSPVFRDTVFAMQRDEVVTMAVDAVRQIRALTDARPETHWTLEYSPETFSATELEFAREICDAVTDAWGATPERKVILNLPATVEMATPNVYADQIEWMHRNVARRNSVIISVHPHNDRGCAVAAAELAMMAGAERVEGCLFGHGERTGNVDLVTLALNLYSQGVDPQLDFSDIDRIARTVEECTQLPVHPRHPYTGDLVFTAFSGSHQDAIKKGMAVRDDATHWQVPYLPVDPSDLGRSYDSIIRVNSQSGKGGIAYLLESGYGLVMPRRLQIEFSGVVQQHTDATGAEVSADELWQIFNRSYVQANAPLRYVEHHLFEHGDAQGVKITVAMGERRFTVSGEGNGPIDAIIHALRVPVRLLAYEERSLGQGADARAVAFVEMAGGDQPGSTHGVGIDDNIVTASIFAVLSGINRIAARDEAIVADLDRRTLQAA
ncbi:MAG TPA: 2-isopropylmalate synthase [Azospira sp.]|nr:2-isopropylmalate synthase [Azospira sp.]HNN07756.1 2-isopropylmalate synthase [Azospira sp.]HNN45699.1 2-isopropylmalate synthase [Azospira sp.]